MAKTARPGPAVAAPGLLPALSTDREPYLASLVRPLGVRGRFFYLGLRGKF